jgi:O-methyltransferase involved in polyketide biosynthesis
MTATRTHHEVSCSATVGVGATATMVAGYRAAATKCDQPMIDDPFAEPLVRGRDGLLYPVGQRGLYAVAR